MKQNIKKSFKKLFVLYLLVKLFFQRFLFQESNFVFQENTVILRASSFFMGVAIEVIIEKILKIILGLILCLFYKGISSFLFFISFFLFF